VEMMTKDFRGIEAQEIHRETNNTQTNFYLFKSIYMQMLVNQKISRYCLENDIKLENARSNFITWMFMLKEKIEFSFETLFNTISMTDNLFTILKNDDLPINVDPKLYQLLAIVSFEISFKFFEKKTLPLSFVENNLLNYKWTLTEIKKAEIFVLQKIDYNVNQINFFSFYQFFLLIIPKHFTKNMQNKLNFLVVFTMKRALITKEFIFKLNPLEQIIIILNTSFLLLQQLIDFNVMEQSEFFIELSYLTANHNFNEFEKFSSILISNLKFSQELIEAFNSI